MGIELGDILAKVIKEIASKSEDIRDEVLKGHVVVTIQRTAEDCFDDSLVNYEDLLKIKLPLKAMCRSGEHEIQVRSSMPAIPVAERILEVAHRVIKEQSQKLGMTKDKCDNPDCEACREAAGEHAEA